MSVFQLLPAAKKAGTYGRNRTEGPTEKTLYSTAHLPMLIIEFFIELSYYLTFKLAKADSRQTIIYEGDISH